MRRFLTRLIGLVMMLAGFGVFYAATLTIKIEDTASFGLAFLGAVLVGATCLVWGWYQLVECGIGSDSP